MQVQLTSYRLVRQELLKTLEQSKAHLESFTEDTESHGQLNAFVDLTEQILGCLKMLGLQGVDTLTREVLHLATHLRQIPDQQRRECLSAISCSLIELEQYLEYLDHKEAELPALLLGGINRLRKSGSKEPLPEHYFYAQNKEFVSEVSRQLESSLDLRDSSVPKERLSRLRQMYQIGLADYIRETNLSSSPVLMERALNRTIDQGISSSYSLVFRFAAAALGAVSNSKIKPTKERKQLFAAIDRQFRTLINKPHSTQKAEHSHNLIRGFGYLFLISGCTDQAIRALVEEFSIKPLFFTESDIELEREILIRPDASASRSLMRALSSELSTVKENIELAFKSSELNNTIDFSTLIAPIKELSRIFSMAKMTDSVEITQELLVRIEQWDTQKSVLSENQFSEIADQLTLIENQMHQINSSRIPTKDKTSVQLGILQEAQQHVIAETKDGLALTKRSIDAYLSSGGDSMNLVNLTTLMETVRGGTLFLGLKEVTEILKICQQYIQSNLVESSEALKPESLETLADVIISVEYYLENMDFNLNSNQKILTLAEDGIKELAA